MQKPGSRKGGAAPTNYYKGNSAIYWLFIAHQPQISRVIVSKYDGLYNGFVDPISVIHRYVGNYT